MNEGSPLKVGQLVEVRDIDEILATLDKRGELDSLPFMPEMTVFCGRRFRIGKIANKTCDTMSRTGIRRMDDAVHLADLRCDGSGHDGCEAGCYLYWRTAWLRPVSADDPAPPERPQVEAGTRTRIPLLVSNSVRSDVDGSERYVCQATELLRVAPHTLSRGSLGQYVTDVRIGNATPWFSFRALLVGYFNVYQGRSIRLPQWLRIRGGLPWRFIKGTLTQTPTGETHLKPGDLVRIKSKDEIMATLNTENKNRGMGFESEMARFCGRTARVARRVNQIIEEPTGRMIKMKYPCIVLEDLSAPIPGSPIICEGAYHQNCPRAIPAYWREIWLDKIAEPA